MPIKNQITAIVSSVGLFFGQNCFRDRPNGDNENTCHKRNEKIIDVMTCILIDQICSTKKIVCGLMLFILKFNFIKNIKNTALCDFLDKIFSIISSKNHRMVWFGSI